jgi:hypothetical protein
LRIRFLLTACLLCGTGTFAKKKPPAQPVNINAATLEELQLVPGIGPFSEILVRDARGGLEVQRHLVGDADSIAFEGNDFFRVIG